MVLSSSKEGLIFGGATRWTLRLEFGDRTSRRDAARGSEGSIWNGAPSWRLCGHVWMSVGLPPKQALLHLCGYPAILVIVMVHRCHS